MTERERKYDDSSEELETLRRRLKELERAEQECVEVKDALQAKEERLKIMASAVDSAVSAIAIADLEGKLVYVNQSFLRMWRYEGESEVLGEPATRFWHMQEMAREVVKALWEQENWIGELVAMKKDGSLFHAELSASMVCDEKGSPICMMASFVDITRRKILENELRSMSFIDDLTGLYNRRGFMMLVQQHLRLAARMKKGVYLLFADMDGLKEVNDKFGHREGDQALVEIADILKKTVRDSDLVARISGDEFAAVAVDADGIGVGILSNRFQESLDKHNLENLNRPYTLSVSMGIAYSNPQSPCTVDELLRRADALMYEKKGRDRKETPPPGSGE